MKKALILLALLGAAVYVASWFWAGDEVNAAADKPWPDGLGTLDAVRDRYPPQPVNGAALKLTTLAAAVGESEAVTAYVRAEIARGDLAIAEPPAIADLSAIRDLLLREPVVWERDLDRQHGGLLLNVALYRSLTRALIASALGRARRNDAAAWDDLHAAWNLNKSVEGQPPRITRLVAMSMTRAINAVAWKMPLPAPAWFDEVQERDFVRPLFETLQYEKWFALKHEAFLVRPLAVTIDRERNLVSELMRVTACEFHPGPAARPPDADDGSALDVSWQRAFRYRAEREATANALRARGGKPIAEGSRCSDGRWSFDGTTLRFAKPIPLPEKVDTSMPLALHVGRDQARQ